MNSQVLGLQKLKYKPEESMWWAWKARVTMKTWFKVRDINLIMLL